MAGGRLPTPLVLGLGMDVSKAHFKIYEEAGNILKHILPR